MIHHHQTAKWRLIGSLLGISDEQLETIECNYKSKEEDCSSAMVDFWLTVDVTASWEKFKMAIDKVSQLISEVKTFLQQHYDNRYIERFEVSLPYKAECFTNVAFIHHKHNEVTEESVTVVINVMYNGDIIIDNGYSGEPQQCSDYYNSCSKSTDVFKFICTINSISDQKPFFLLIEGAPGMGKTIICNKIASHLSKQQNNELTFLVNLHETNAHSINSFEEFFECVCPGKQKEFKYVSDYLRSTKGKKVKVIIDGYEQLFCEPNCISSSFITDIINYKVLQFQLCDLIVSTRHAALIDLNHYESWYKIELLGFTEELQHQYLQRSLSRPESLNDIIKLKSSSVLKSLCFHPLFINYLVTLYQKLNGLPNSKLN